MFTLFQILTQDGWASTVARPLYPRMWYIWHIIIFYMGITTYGIMNIIVGVIVENTLQAAKNNEEKMAARSEKKTQKNLELLRDIFERADTDGGGTVDKEEFINILKLPETIKQFEVLEVPAGEAEELFDILDEEKAGELPIDKFVHGFMILKGEAKAKDLMTVVFTTMAISRRTNDLEKYLNEVIESVANLPAAVDAAVKRAVSPAWSEEVMYPMSDTSDTSPALLEFDHPE